MMPATIRMWMIGVAAARQPAGIVGRRDQPAGALGADVEIDHPHGDAADESDQERADVRGGPGQAGEGRAGDQHRFAERDDDEQRAALGHVGALDVPVGGGRTAEHRHPEAEQRRRRFRCRPRSPTAPAAPRPRPGRRRSRAAPSCRCQRPMRTKLRKLPASWRLSAHSMNRLRPTCMTHTPARTAARARSNAFGIDGRHEQARPASARTA